jgi:hypothetical protein
MRTAKRGVERWERLAVSQDFFGGAARFVPRNRDTQQNFSDRGCLFRSNGVVEWFIEPKKPFVWLYLYSTTGRSGSDYFFIRHAHR